MGRFSNQQVFLWSIMPRRCSNTDHASTLDTGKRESLAIGDKVKMVDGTLEGWHFIASLKKVLERSERSYQRTEVLCINALG